jgi:hypothetical protein
MLADTNPDIVQLAIAQLSKIVKIRLGVVQ